MAIRAAYETGGDQAKGYRQSLVDNAEKYGMSPEEVGKIDNPVLVRIRDTPVDSIDKRYDLVRRMGKSTVARMSEPETAKADAAKLMRGSALDVLDTSNDLHGPTNRPFVRAFMDGVPHSERPDLVTEDGGLSAQGLRRVRNAILATAYGNDATVARMTESLDDNIKGVGNAMVQAAPGFAKLKQLIDSGARTPELDITADVTAAANALSHIRESRSHLKEYFDQLGLFGKGLTPVGEELLRAFDKYKSSPKKMAMVLKGYTEQADTTDDPRQSSMFDDKPPATPDSLLRAALNFVETANRDNEATLGFETTPGPETRSNRAGLPETEARGGNETAPAEVSSAELTREAPKGITPVHDQSSYESAPTSVEPVTSTAKTPRPLAQSAAEHDTLAQEAMDRVLKRSSTRLTSGIAPEDLADLAVYASHKLASGALKAADFASHMAETFGDWVKPHLDRVWKMAQSMGEKPQGEESSPTKLGEPERTMGEFGLNLDRMNITREEKDRLVEVTKQSEDAINIQRQKGRTWEQVKAGAKALNADYEQFKNIEPGTALGTDPQNALRDLVPQYQRDAKAARIEAQYNPTPENISLANDLTNKEVHLVKILHGTTSTAGQVLNAQKITAEAYRTLTPTEHDIFRTLPADTDKSAPKPPTQQGWRAKNTDRGKDLPAAADKKALVKNAEMAEIRARIRGTKDPCVI